MNKYIFSSLVIIMSLNAGGQTKPGIDWVSIPAGTFTMEAPRATKGQVAEIPIR